MVCALFAKVQIAFQEQIFRTGTYEIGPESSPILRTPILTPHMLSLGFFRTVVKPKKQYLMCAVWNVILEVSGGSMTWSCTLDSASAGLLPTCHKQAKNFSFSISWMQPWSTKTAFSMAMDVLSWSATLRTLLDVTFSLAWNQVNNFSNETGNLNVSFACVQFSGAPDSWPRGCDGDSPCLHWFGTVTFHTIGSPADCLEHRSSPCLTSGMVTFKEESRVSSNWSHGKFCTPLTSASYETFSETESWDHLDDQSISAF